MGNARLDVEKSEVLHIKKDYEESVRRQTEFKEKLSARKLKFK
jgi:hypothetical protein